LRCAEEKEKIRSLQKDFPRTIRKVDAPNSTTVPLRENKTARMGFKVGPSRAPDLGKAPIVIFHDLDHINSVLNTRSLTELIDLTHCKMTN
jgi:hypothetical protein